MAMKSKGKDKGKSASNAFDGQAVGIQVSQNVWVLELAGLLSLPSTARAVILRKHVPQPIEPSLLLLDVIPLAISGTTDVITPHPVGYLDTGFGMLPTKSIDLLYGGKVIASVPVKRVKA